ncbi:SBBP repeat-containing protein [bacterium]|nr:SBBP repeat-containing protein [bacterium]
MLKSAKFHTKNLHGLVLGSGLLSLFCLFAQASATTLEFSTFLGGSGSNSDKGNSVSTDGSENCYVTGNTWSSDFPVTAGAYDTAFSSGDVFVTKLNSTGSSLLYSTFLGGSSYDVSYSLSLDGSGNSYVNGITQSIDFPTTAGAYDTSQNGSSDAFVTKLNSGGSSLVFSTFLGGSESEIGNSLSLDGNGNCYVAGYTYSTDFPITAGAYDTSFNGGDAFVTKLNSAGSSLDYSTFIGGSGEDGGYSFSVDGSGNCYVTGYTGSSGFYTSVGAYDTSFNGGNYDVFVTKLNSTGSSLDYSTFIGGSGDDEGFSLSVDGSGNCYVTGFASPTGFPATAGAYDTSFNGVNNDVFVTKLNSAGSSLLYSTYLGGSSDDQGFSLSVDGTGNCYVTGYTGSNNFLATAGAFDTSYNGSISDVFLTKLNSTGSSLLYSTFLGGSDWDYGRSLSVDGSGNCYVTGYTNSSDFPTTVGAFDTSYNGGDAFVTKFDLFTGLKEQNNSAKNFQLEQNFPNPFNPNTTISYTLAKNNEVKLEVYNTNGELVRVLVSEKQNEGSHSSNWNGKDENGNVVSSGVYFYKLTAGNYTKTNQMILLK